MDSADLQVLEAACTWFDQGRRVLLATVLRTFGSSPRPPGAWLALADNGLVAGSVSGGCIEDDLVDRLGRGALDCPTPFLLTYGTSQEEAQRFGLPCGGTLELLIEPSPDAAALRDLRQRLAAGQLARRRVALGDGATAIETGTPADRLEFDGQQLSVPHGPRRRLLIIGAGQISRFVAEMALALDYAVTLCDPREEYARQWAVPGCALTMEMPDDTVVAWQPDPASAIVALSHDPKLDDLALLEALKSPAFYVGALGARSNQEKRRQRLALFDLAPEEIDRLHGPVGLALGSRTPPEIAIAILAEMTAIKNGVAVPRLERLQATSEAANASDTSACGTAPVGS
ncbi:MAG TPA: XdhC family protein [Azospira sp.]|nr:XdhC family protein [Azospira sp.]